MIEVVNRLVELGVGNFVRPMHHRHPTVDIDLAVDVVRAIRGARQPGQRGRRWFPNGGQEFG
jgi:hypothetical protein